MSQTRRIIAVFGGTGLQGSSVVNAVLEDGTFAPRVITRNPDSEAAKNLLARGVEVVKADLNVIESLQNVLQGCECVFGVTQPFEKGSDEVQQGKNLADACKRAGVQLFIWSSLFSITKESGGKYTQAAHFDNKAKVEEYLQESGVPYAILRTSFFLENLNNFGMLQKTDKPDELTFSIPIIPISTSLPITWVDRDVGLSVVALCKQYKEKNVVGQTFLAARVRWTLEDICNSFSKALGKKINFVSSPSAGIAAVEEAYLFVKEFGFFSGQPIPDPKLIELGVDFSTPIIEYASVLKSKGF